MTAASLRSRWRSVALPAEHGSWGLTLEPIFLGLLVAPSWGGVGLGVAAFSAFLLRWPLKVARTSRRQKRSERAALATGIALTYGVIALLGLLAGIWFAGMRPLLPLAAALPFGAVFLLYDAQNRSRSWQAELAGPIAFSATAASIALADNWAMAPALALWAVLVARAVPSVLYVRSRIRLDRGKSASVPITLMLHAVALAGVIGLIGTGLLPRIASLAFVLLLVRAAWGLSDYRRPVSIKTIGFSEMGWGLLTVLTVAAGYV